MTAAALLLSLHHTTAASAAYEGWTMTPRCERQVREEKIEHCEQYLRSEMAVFVLPPGSGNQACCLRECCDMLRQMDEDCVCETVQSLLRGMRERVTVGEERGVGRMVMRKAMELPMRCGITARGCQIRVSKAVLDAIY